MMMMTAYPCLLATYLTTILGMNVSPMQTWRIVRDLGIVSRRPKLALEHAEDYAKKKKIVDTTAYTSQEQGDYIGDFFDHHRNMLI